jgi:hypothetical protein
VSSTTSRRTTTSSEAILQPARRPVERGGSGSASLPDSHFTNPGHSNGDLSELINTAFRSVQVHQVHERVLNVTSKSVQGEVQAPFDLFAKSIREFDIACADKEFHVIPYM